MRAQLSPATAAIFVAGISASTCVEAAAADLNVSNGMASCRAVTVKGIRNASAGELKSAIAEQLRRHLQQHRHAQNAKG